MSKRNSMKIPSDISFDCPGSKSGMSLEITQRDISDMMCDEQLSDENVIYDRDK